MTLIESDCSALIVLLITGKQGVEACHFESMESPAMSLCHFKTQNWRRANTSPAGPRFDHTLGELQGWYNPLVTMATMTSI